MADDAAVDVLTADGHVAVVRRVRPDDLQALTAFHDAVGDEAFHRRFFSLDRATGRRYVEHLCADGTDAVVLVALRDGRIVAVASAEPTSPGVADVAFLVADQAHGLGLGTLLLEHLAAAARDRGIREFTAEVLAENLPMLKVFADCGFELHRHSDGGEVTLRLGTDATAQAIAAADERESLSEARSLSPLLHPCSVALLGVRRDGTGLGRAVLYCIRAGGFAGRLYVVHPSAPEIAGAPTYPSLEAVGEPLDLVVVALPAAAVPAAVEEAALAGARSAVVLSSGFAEIDPTGRIAQREMVRVARAHSMRLVGPNCLGVMSPPDALNATFAHPLPPAGGLAVATQSGGVGIALMELATRGGLGLASFVSLGNKADVSGNDLLAAWLQDDQVTAAALYLESFGNARKFARFARRFAQRKPLLAVTGGRSASGRQAGLSHTAGAAAPSVGIDALFAQSGVIGCPSLETLVDTARLLDQQPLPAGPRLGIIGNAGGLGVLAADTASRHGLVVPRLSAGLAARITPYAAGSVGLTNPVDLGAGASGAGLLEAARALFESDETDAVLVVLAGTAATQVGAFLDPFADAVRAASPAKPVLLVSYGEVTVPDAVPFTRFDSVEQATDALARANTYARWRDTPADGPAADFPGAAELARSVADSALRDRAADASGWMSLEAARRLLAAYAVTPPAERVVTTEDDAVAAAEQTGFPVVVKCADSTVVHKTDRGLVHLALTTPHSVRQAFRAITRELGDEQPVVVVQEQVASGTEVAVGLVRDPAFGPLVMVGAGGVATDVWADRVFLVPPIGPRDAARAIRSLRIWSLLAGFRGSPPVDVTALERLLTAVGQLAGDVPHVVEMDLNPVVCTPGGVTCVDAKVRLVAPVAADDGVPRRLRAPA